MKFRRRIILRTLWFGLLLLSLFFCRACIVRPMNDYAGSHFNTGKNAAWLSIEWVNEPKSEDEISALVQELESLQITYIFVYVSYYKDYGDFNPTYDYADEFLELFESTDIQVLAWIGLPLGNTDLGDSEVRQQVIEFSQQMVNLGFDGVHLNPEPTVNNNQDLLLLLDEIRPVLGEDALLSIATHRIWPVFANDTWPDSQQTIWQPQYYRDIAQRVDQIAVMVYDSFMTKGWMYRHWGRFQTLYLTQALKDEDVEVFIGIPTSEEETLTHNPDAENMENGLRGTILGLNDHHSYPNIITGVAIYPHWETDETEWQTYRELWLGQ